MAEGVAGGVIEEEAVSDRVGVGRRELDVETLDPRLILEDGVADGEVVLLVVADIDAVVVCDAEALREAETMRGLAVRVCVSDTLVLAVNDAVMLLDCVLAAEEVGDGEDDDVSDDVALYV